MVAALLSLAACGGGSGGGGEGDGEGTGGNVAPVARANGPYTGTTGVAVAFSSAGSNDPDGSIARFSWTFGDGATSNSANPTHVYANAGNYGVTLRVTDNNGANGTSSTTAKITLPGGNLPPVANANGPYVGTVGNPVAFSSAGSNDPDGSIATYAWNFGDGGTAGTANPSHVYTKAGSYSVTLTVTDNANGTGTDTTSATITVTGACGNPQVPPGTSINSTSRDSNCQNMNVVTQRSKVGSGSYSVLAINDLGMHCGDFDTRIASILPPFQVLLTQVVRKGATPQLNPAGVSVYYSAAANPNDPILARGASVFEGVKGDGSTYKTNFWDSVTNGAYDPFYPPSVTPLRTGPFPVTPDKGLPVPNVADLFIGPDGRVNSGDESLTAAQHAMPGLTGAYTANVPQQVQERYIDKPFFVNFPFGYVAKGVNWYEAAGVPFAAFDDFGRENPYPLVRVEARASGSVVSTVDTVLPISGEASCTNCHADPADVQNSRTAQPTDALRNAGLPVAVSLDDPDPNLPSRVSVEYASDINILRLHDLHQGADYVDTSGASDPCTLDGAHPNGNASCLINRALVQKKPIVCQVCHYTPALDLAQVGPQAGPPGSDANGRNQLAHQSNSRVMHNFHGQFTSLFTPIPAPSQDANGNVTNQATRLTALDNNCYQCHPGKNTRCLRGAMFNADMLCSDCHGSLLQVGADFSANVSPSNPGAFVLNKGNFYTPGSSQPRVPWANEPTCGSCHTGDASSNLTGSANVLVNRRDTDGNVDGIRLRQAFRSGDARATPIVPTNKRFAEPAVPASYNGFTNPGAGNPQLYRVSTGHGGIMCEGCHGATHSEWPNANPNSNDNLTAVQLQGHTGFIMECSTCHGSNDTGNNLNGPHGMHPVGDNTSWARGGHENLAENNSAICAVCHGPGSRSQNQGTVLSRAAADRHLGGTLVAKGEPVGCTVCH